MTYLACLKFEYSGLNLDQLQIAEVFQNTIIVNFLQLTLVFFIWYYAINDIGLVEFLNVRDSYEILCVRFIASLMMHLNVEKDLRNGISMMKYCVNHWQNFNNLGSAFCVSFLLTISSILIEFTVIEVLISLPNILEVIMKYVSLAAIANIPRFYFGSLVDHKLLKANGHKLVLENFRHMNPRKNAPCQVHVMRFIHKSCRMYFCVWCYYFMPFTGMFITYFVNEREKSDPGRVVEQIEDS